MALLILISSWFACSCICLMILMFLLKCNTQINQRSKHSYYYHRECILNTGTSRKYFEGTEPSWMSFKRRWTIFNLNLTRLDIKFQILLKEASPSNEKGMKLSSCKLRVGFESFHIGANNLCTYIKRSQENPFSALYSAVKQPTLVGIYMNYRK